MSDEEAVDVVTSLSSNKLPENFWSLGAFKNQTPLQDLHMAVVERLQLESPDADTLELMLMERVCFLYIFMRAKEVADAQAETLDFNATYQKMLSTWVGMAADLRKQRLRAEEISSVRLAVVSEVSRALKEALKDVDPGISHAVQTKLVTLVAV